MKKKRLSVTPISARYSLSFEKKATKSFFAVLLTKIFFSSLKKMAFRVSPFFHALFIENLYELKLVFLFVIR